MTEATDRLTAALADRYRIEHMLGKGGMATVYLARDSRHDRDVAIKVLNGELTESLGRQRFLRETRDSSLCSESPPHGDTMARRSMQWTGGAALLLGTLMLGVLGARFAPHTSDVDEVWAMEDAYWRYVKAGDVEKYRTLWNDGFRGWPCHTGHPATKASIGDWVKEIHDGKITFEYKLTREGASNVNGVVVVFYWTPMIWKYADGRVDGRQDLPRKFTHTWMKVDGKWQIIGGMCGADAPRS